MVKKIQWLEECIFQLENYPNKKIILIGGPSSVGKTYKCGELKKYLESKNFKCLVVSLDNFYKPISKRFANFVVERFADLKPRYEEIYHIIADITKQVAFDDKFSEQNKLLLIDKLKQITTEKKSIQILNQLISYHQSINFDVPDAIDFDEIKNQINSKKFVSIPNYSFKTSERIDFEKFDKNDYDYILFEGIFALDDRIVKNINNDNVIKISFKCDLLSMLSRRLYRDIMQGRRTRSPKETFEAYFEQVMPSYSKYIEPTLNNADAIINSSLTDEEILLKDNTETDNNYCYNYKITAKHCNNIELFISIKNEEPIVLTFKYKINNKFLYENYDLKNLLQQKDSTKLINYFKNNQFIVFYTKEQTNGNIKTL